MDIVKKNIISIICGVVILAAIISWFWPIGGIEASFAQDMKKQASIYDQLRQIRSKSRTWPVIDLDGTEGVHLDQFPNEKFIAAGSAVSDELALKSKLMEENALKMNQQKVLVEGVLPTTTDPGPILRFRDNYRTMIQKTIPTDFLQATTPPTDEEIDKAMDKLWQDKYVQKFIYVNGKAVNEDKVSAEFTAEVAGMPKRIRDERASKYQCYVDDGAISMSDVMAGEGRTPSLGEVWYAQSSLWVQEDIARSIARLNAGAQSVIKAPVKHIRLLQVNPTIGQYLRAAVATNGLPAAAADASAAADPSAPLPKDFTLTPTGRVSNQKYDVVQFSLRVVVDVASIPMLLQELSREKYFMSQRFGVEPAPSTFATITKMDITTVDNALAFEQGFVYGNRPVVELSLQGESLFLRAWTLPLMPASVKQELGIETPASDAAKTPANAG